MLKVWKEHSFTLSSHEKTEFHITALNLSFFTLTTKVGPKLPQVIPKIERSLRCEAVRFLRRKTGGRKGKHLVSHDDCLRVL